MPDRGISVIFPPSKSTQRVGSLTVLAHLSKPTRSTGTLDLARSYIDTLRSPVPVAAENVPDLEVWLRRRNLARKYRDLSVVEAQDWLLSDPSLPSGTGSERDDTRTAVDLAVQLGVLREESNRRTWVGDWFVKLTPTTIDRVRTGERRENVFRVRPHLRLSAAWCAFAHDGDGLQLVRRLLNSAAPGCEVTATELFSRVPGLISGWVNDIEARVRASDDTQKVKRLREAEVLFAREPGGRSARQGAVTKQTQRRRFEDFLYWRLETLVDLGLLAKRDKDQYSYTVLTATQNLADPRLETLDSRRRGLFKWWGEQAAPTSQAPAESEWFNVIAEANQRQANSMGYSLIEEATVVANVLLLERGQRPCIDEDDVRTIVASPPEGARTLSSVDRNGNLSAFKVARP